MDPIRVPKEILEVLGIYLVTTVVVGELEQAPCVTSPVLVHHCSHDSHIGRLTHLELTATFLYRCLAFRHRMLANFAI